MTIAAEAITPNEPTETALPSRPPAPARTVAPTMPTGAVARLELLLRDPEAFFAAVERLDDADDQPALASITRALLGAIVGGASLFGVVIGAHRGGLQVLWCAIKLPLLLLVTLVVCAPTFVALARAASLDRRPRGIVTLSLGAAARFALVLTCLAPFVWLIEGWTMGYHRVILSVVAVCAVAGVAAGNTLFRGLARSGSAGVRVGVAFVAVFALVGAQTSWLLRPFVVRPRTEHVPFVRALEGDFVDSVATSARSATGHYRSESQPVQLMQLPDVPAFRGGGDAP